MGTYRLADYQWNGSFLSLFRFFRLFRVWTVHFRIGVALRLGMAWMVGVRRLGDKILRDNLLLVPLRDFFSLFIWSAALFGKRVEWRGRVFRLEENGKLKPEKTSR